MLFLPSPCRCGSLARTDGILESELPTTDRGAETLTEIEQKILDFMVQYLRENTYQPSIRDIGERFGIKSTKTVSEYLQALADKGRLERDPSRSRGVKILGVDLSGNTISVPCFSSIAASRGADAQSYISVDRQLGGRKGSFIVRARASELAVLGVTEGDLVLVSPVEFEGLEDGAVIVVGPSQAPMFCRFRKSGSSVSLEDLHPGGQGTVVKPSDSVQLWGRVAGFYRRMEGVGSLNFTHH